MSATINPRDLLMQSTPTRLLPITLPPNLVIPGLGQLEPNLDMPPTPSGFSAVGSLTYVSMKTNPPVFTQGHGYSHTKVYGAIWSGGPFPVLADAVPISSFVGEFGTMQSAPATRWHLWVTWVSKDGIESMLGGGANGVVGVTGEDVEKLVAAMTGPGKPFTVVNEPTVLTDGTIVPAGTYTSTAFMGRFVAGRGQIGLLAVDDARIASVSVDKLTAGAIRVGQYISSSNYIGGQAGFAMWGNGNAEFNNAMFRGGIQATYGTIGGNTITSGGIYSPNFSDGVSGWGMDINGNAQFNSISLRGSIMGGAFRGYGWPANGGVGFYIGPPGLLLGNAGTGRYFQVTDSGNVYAPGMSIENGTLTINQVNVIDTLNVRGEAISALAYSSGAGSASIVRSLIAGQPVYMHGSVSGFIVDVPNEGPPAVLPSNLLVNGAVVIQSVPVAVQGFGVRNQAACSSTTCMSIYVPPYSGNFTFQLTGGGYCYLYINQTKR